MSDKFSERYGFEAKSMKIQRDSVDEGLRTSLWNILFLHVFDPLLRYQSPRLRDSNSYPFFEGMWHNYFNWAIDRLPAGTIATIDEIRGYFFQCRWYEVYDLLEYIIETYGRTGLKSLVRSILISGLNESLEKEQSAYRLVAGKFVAITSEEEIKEVELAASEGVSHNIREHISKAIARLSDRPKPDCRNSMNESITAVEAACRLVSGQPKATLGKTLPSLEKAIGLHPDLRKLLNSLYTYTNNAGIRHAGGDDSSLSYAEARLMLVMCSSFVNYLLEKASQAGIHIPE